MTFMELLPHLIWTGALGLAVGNYATSWVYRMPKGESPFTKHPYCGGCGTMLGVKDLIPGVSYPMLGGKCRHCEMSIPAVYWWVEIFCAVVFMWGIVTYGWVEAYMLVVLGGTVAVTLWAQEMRSEKIFASVLLFLGAIGASYRILLDGTIYDACWGFIWGGGLPLAYWRIFVADPENLNGEKGRLELPISASLGAVAGVWLSHVGLLLFVPLWAALACMYPFIAKGQKDWPNKSLTVPYVLALMLCVLNPQWIEGMKMWLIDVLRQLAS